MFPVFCLPRKKSCGGGKGWGIEGGCKAVVLVDFWWDFMDKPSIPENANCVLWSVQISKELKDNIFWKTCERATTLSHRKN